jgi:hypothetical protein
MLKMISEQGGKSETPVLRSTVEYSGVQEEYKWSTSGVRWSTSGVREVRWSTGVSLFPPCFRTNSTISTLNTSGNPGLFYLDYCLHLRSCEIYCFFLCLDKNESTGSLFIKYTDYPLVEERTLECFTPLNDVLKSYNFKKYDDNEITNEQLSEKDERQLRKLRLVSILRNLCQKTDDKTKKKIFEHLITYVKDDVVCFESSSPIIQQIPSSNFGVPGDRRTIQVCLNNHQY